MNPINNERTYRKMITAEQIKIYKENRMTGQPQYLAAAKSGFSKRTARRIDHNEHQIKRSHDWVTRNNPFEEVWDNEIVPLLEQGVYQATFLLQVLQKNHPDKYPDTMLRTLQRKIKEWKALNGPNKEVMFRQVHAPGDLGISDFTHPDTIEVTVCREPLVHIFYHFRLVYSGFNYVQVFEGSGEPYEAFAQGLQEALFFLGGSPKTHRTDSLSASFKNMDKNACDDLTDRYRAFAEHFNMNATRINPGESHENGAVESSHGHIKRRIFQSLIVRGSNDFTSLEEYREFVREVVKQHNRYNCKNLEAEKATLQQLPSTKAVDYKEAVAVVSSTSTINVKRVTYSVPSRLIGERLHIRIYSDKLECYLSNKHVITLIRARNSVKGKRDQVIDYRHLIGSLVKKPGAFRGSQLRNALLPNDNYRYIWEHVDRTMNDKDACRFIVGLLQLAATRNCEAELSQAVIALIENGQQLKLSELQDRFNKLNSAVPVIHTPQHPIAIYNQFIPNYQEVQI